MNHTDKVDKQYEIWMYNNIQIILVSLVCCVSALIVSYPFLLVRYFPVWRSR